MILFDILFINIYKFLTFLNSFALYGNKNEARFHTFIVFSGILGLNLFNLISFFYFLFFRKNLPIFASFCLIGISFIINYFIYYKKNRIVKIFNSKLFINNYFHYILTLVFVILTFYLMFSLTDFIRNQKIN